jgi:hypothetical protein
MRRATPRTVLAPEPPPACVSTPCGVLLGQRRAAESPCGSSFVATRDASDRLLPSHVFVRAPAPRRFPGSSTAFAPAPRRHRLPHVSAIRFGGPHVLPWIHHGGLVVPVVMRANRTSDVPVASPSRVIPLARGAHPEEPPRPPSTLSRERGGCSDDPGHLPSDELLCPATPSRAPGSGLPGSAAWPPRFSGCRHLFTSLWILADTTDRPGPRPRAPLPTGVTLLWASASLADFCNLFLRRAGTPYEPSILAREWSFRSAARRHQPMPVALASAMRCRTGDLRATTCTLRLSPPRSTRVDRADREPKRSSEGEPRAL